MHHRSICPRRAAPPRPRHSVPGRGEAHNPARRRSEQNITGWSAATAQGGTRLFSSNNAPLRVSGSPWVARCRQPVHGQRRGSPGRPAYGHRSARTVGCPPSVTPQSATPGGLRGATRDDVMHDTHSRGDGAQAPHPLCITTFREYGRDPLSGAAHSPRGVGLPAGGSPRRPGPGQAGRLQLDQAIHNAELCAAKGSSRLLASKPVPLPSPDPARSHSALRAGASRGAARGHPHCGSPSPQTTFRFDPLLLHAGLCSSLDISGAAPSFVTPQTKAWTAPGLPRGACLGRRRAQSPPSFLPSPRQLFCRRSSTMLCAHGTQRGSPARRQPPTGVIAIASARSSQHNREHAPERPRLLIAGPQRGGGEGGGPTVWCRLAQWGPPDHYAPRLGCRTVCVAHR